MKPLGLSTIAAKPAGVGWAVGASLMAHGVVLAAIVWGWPSPSRPDGLQVMDVELVVAAAGEPDRPPTQAGGVTPPSLPAPDTKAQPAAPPDPTSQTTASDDDRTAAEVAIIVPVPPAPPVVQPHEWQSPPPGPVPAGPESRPAAAAPLPLATDAAPPPSSTGIAPPPPVLAASKPPSAPATPPPSGAAAASKPASVPSPTKTAAPLPPASAAPSRTTVPDLPRASSASVPSPPMVGGSAADSPASGPGSEGARLIRHIAPVYPPLARERGQEGRVVVRLVIGTDGVPGDIRVAQSSGIAALDAAALEAVRQWRFAPARRAGTPAPEERLAPVVFRLRH